MAEFRADPAQPAREPAAAGSAIESCATRGKVRHSARLSFSAGYFFPDLRGGGVCGFIVCTNDPFLSFWASLPALNCPAPVFLPPFFPAMVLSCNDCYFCRFELSHAVPTWYCGNHALRDAEEIVLGCTTIMITKSPGQIMHYTTILDQPVDLS